MDEAYQYHQYYAGNNNYGGDQEWTTVHYGRRRRGPERGRGTAAKRDLDPSGPRIRSNHRDRGHFPSRQPRPDYYREERRYDRENHRTQSTPGRHSNHRRRAWDHASEGEWRLGRGRRPREDWRPPSGLHHRADQRPRPQPRRGRQQDRTRHNWRENRRPLNTPRTRDGTDDDWWRQDGRHTNAPQTRDGPNDDWWRQDTRNTNETRSRDDMDDIQRTEFKQKVRIIHKLIKSLHHFNNLLQDHPPRTIDRMTQDLITLIKPAAPTATVIDQIEGNAKNWQHNIISILKDHYQDSITLSLTELISINNNNCEEQFNIAARWARRNLGRRLLPETVREASRRVMERLRPPSSPPLHPPSSSQLPPTLPAAAETSHSDLWLRSSLLTLHGSSEGELNIFMDPPTTTETGEQQQQQPTSKRTQKHPTPKQQRKTCRGRNQETAAVQNTSPAATARDSEDFLDEEELLLQDNISGDGEQEETPRIAGRPQSRCRGQQTVDTLRDHGTTPPSATNETTLRHPTRHVSTNRKTQDWNLFIENPVIIIGDTNVGQCPAFADFKLQIDSFPGATFRHIKDVINKLQISPEVTMVILSLGIENRTQQLKTATKEIQSLMKSMYETFPNAIIRVSQINYSTNLPVIERELLEDLNKFIKSKYKTVEQLPAAEFNTGDDNVTWTPETADRMFRWWCMTGN